MICVSNGYDCTKTCQRQICCCCDSFMSIQCANSSAPLEFKPKLNQPTISFFFVTPFRLYTATIKVTSASWNSATCNKVTFETCSQIKHTQNIIQIPYRYIDIKSTYLNLNCSTNSKLHTSFFKILANYNIT
jgi:hypothetical protein